MPPRAHARPACSVPRPARTLDDTRVCKKRGRDEAAEAKSERPKKKKKKQGGREKKENARARQRAADDNPWDEALG